MKRKCTPRNAVLAGAVARSTGVPMLAVPLELFTFVIGILKRRLPLVAVVVTYTLKELLLPLV